MMLVVSASYLQICKVNAKCCTGVERERIMRIEVVYNRLGMFNAHELDYKLFTLTGHVTIISYWALVTCTRPQHCSSTITNNTI